MTTGSVNYKNLGDVASLDVMESELGASAPVDLSETAQRQQEIESAGGIMFPYDPALAASLGVFAGIGGNVAAKKWGGHWNFTQEESEKLGVAIGQVVERYFPDMEPVNPLWNLAFVSGAVIGPKLLLNVMGGSNEQSTD